MINLLITLLLFIFTGEIQENIVHTAQSSVGTIGGKVYQKYTGTPGQPWCVSFVVYTVNKAAEKEILPKMAYSLGLYSWAKRHELITKMPTCGDIIIWKRKKNHRYGHVGIVEKVDKTNNKIYTIEGNVGSDVVKRMTRSYNGKEKNLILLGYINTKKLYEQKK